jgi:uncharacterized protein Yka (UPF0111/DUF47 family)
LGEYEESLTKIERDRKASSNNALQEEEYEQLKLASEYCQLEINMLKEEIVEIKTTLSNGKKSLSEKNNLLKAYRRDRKTDAESLYSAIDEILSVYGIRRAAYHGGDLQGNDCIKLMSKAEDIMSEIAELLVIEKDVKCKQSDEEIRQVCNNVASCLTSWNKAFQTMQKHNPTPEDCAAAEQYIKQAMTYARKLKLSITPKLHGMEKHVVDQMKRIPGGIALLMEYWIEKYHQTGSTFDRKHRHARSILDAAEMRVSSDTKRSHPMVQQLLKQVQEATKRKFKAGGDGKMAKKMRL